MSDVCKSDFCKPNEVGPFLDGINEECYDQGSCQLPDIMTVVANVGNYAVGIVGSLVFLMWVISGFRYLGANFLPGGFDENIKKGKQGIVTATVGLLIVFGAFAAIQTLNAWLRAGSDLPQGADEFVDCSFQENDTKACGLNMVCAGLRCMSKCDEQFNFPIMSYVEEDHGSGIRTATTVECIDINSLSSTLKDISGCQVGLCPGPANVQCCSVTRGN